MILKNIGTIADTHIKKIKDAYAKLSVEKRDPLPIQSGGLPIPPSQKPKEEHFTYDGLIDKLKDKLVVIQGNIITAWR